MIPERSVPLNDSGKAKEERPTDNPNQGDENDGDRERKKSKTEAEEEQVVLPTDFEILVHFKNYLVRNDLKYPSPIDYPQLIAFAHEWRPELHPDRIINRIRTLCINSFQYKDGLAGLPAGAEGAQGDVCLSQLMEGLCLEIWRPNDESGRD